MKDHIPILIEIEESVREEAIEALKSLGFTEDETFAPVPISEGTFAHRGWVKKETIQSIKKTPGVRSISEDARIEPF